MRAPSDVKGKAPTHLRTQAECGAYLRNFTQPSRFPLRFSGIMGWLTQSKLIAKQGISVSRIRRAPVVHDRRFDYYKIFDVTH